MKAIWFYFFPKKYKQQNKVFRENNLAWIENSIENLIRKLHITILQKKQDWKLFRIQYYHGIATSKGDYATFLMEINPLGENNCVSFNKIIAKNIPNMKKGAFSLMYLQTVMISYGYFWIKSRFDKYERLLYLNTKHRGYRKETLNEWTEIAKQFIDNLKNPIHIKDFFFLQMQRDLQIDFKKDFENKMMEIIYETEEISDIDVNQYENLMQSSLKLQEDIKSKNNTKLTSQDPDQNILSSKKSKDSPTRNSPHKESYLPINLALDKVNIEDMVHIFLTNREKNAKLLDDKNSHFETDTKEEQSTNYFDANLDHKQQTSDFKNTQSNYDYSKRKLSNNSNCSDSTRSSNQNYFYHEKPFYYYYNKNNFYSKNVYQTSNCPYYQHFNNYYDNTQNWCPKPRSHHYRNDNHNKYSNNYSYHNYGYKNYYGRHYYS